MDTHKSTFNILIPYVFELPEHVSAQQIRTIALSKEVNLRYYENGDVGFSIDETTDVAAANVLLSIFAIAAGKDYQKVDDIPEKSNIDKALKRTTPFLTHEVFSKYHTETEMMRYIKRFGSQRYFACTIR